MRTLFQTAAQNPNIDLALVCLGLVFIAAECLRPGKAVFLSLGSIFFLLGIFGFTRQPINAPALAVLMVGACLVIVAAVWLPRLSMATLGVVCVNLGGASLHPQISFWWSGPILTTLSAMMLILGRLAAIAWRNKHVRPAMVELKDSCHEPASGVSSTLAGYFVLG